MSPNPRIAAIYIRVSTDDQAELSPDSQLETVRAWAGQHGYLVPEQYIYVDEGISGRRADKRPAFNDMIALAKQKDRPIDAILLWKFSRFARNQEESIFYKSMLRRNGVEVVSVSEPIIDGPFGTLIERIIEWMDEYYSIRLAGEVRRSMVLAAQRGQRQTAPPFGYQRNPAGKPFMVPHPEEAEIIKGVFRDYLAGVPVLRMVDTLNAAGVRTHRGGPIENRTIMYWLQNPVYIGKNRWTTTGRARRDFHHPDSVIVDGDHAPLVSQEVFDEVQKRVAEAAAAHRPKARPSFELKDWMGGVCRCATCGSTLVFQRPHYFICNGYVRARCRDRQMITLEDLHDAVLSRLRADGSLSRPVRYTVTSSDETAQELKSLRLQADQYDKRLARLRDAYLNGVDTLEEYKNARDQLNQSQAETQQRIKALESRSDPQLAEAALKKSILSTLATLESDADLHEKNAALKMLIDSCTWQKLTKTLEITYRVFL